MTQTTEDSIPAHLTGRDSIERALVRLLKGVLIGIGTILPGLSGGVLAVIFRVYDPLLRFIANPRRDLVRNLRFFGPILLGVAVGIFVFSLVVEAAFGRYAAQFICLFIGFVVGTFPSLWRAAGRLGRRPLHIVILVAAAAAVFGLMLWGGQSSDLLQVAPSVWAWLGSGAAVGLGAVIPGMSPSNFLIYFGLYDKMAAGVTAFDLEVIIPLIIGVIVCVLGLAKVTAWAFDRYYAGMYHVILGTVVGSSLAILPTIVLPAFSPTGLAASGLTLGAAVTFAAILLVVGTIGSYLFSKVEERVER